MIDDVTACIVLQNRESRGWMYEYGTWVLYCAYALRVEFYCLSRVGGQDTRDSALGGDQGEENGNNTTFARLLHGPGDFGARLLLLASIYVHIYRHSIRWTWKSV